MVDAHVRTVGVVSLHTSPLVQPGSGDGGGMNVYVRELVAALAQSGVSCQVYTRRWDPSLPDVVDIEPGFSVVHVDAGDPGAPKESLEEVVDEFTAGVLDHLVVNPVEVLHAHYWLSGVSGHAIKHELDLPLVSTFHTLGRVKSLAGDAEPEARARAEAQIVGCSDAIAANTRAEVADLERHYDADSARVEIVPPGVDRAFFSPGDQRGARAALARHIAAAGVEVPARLADRPVILFVGRIQPLKGLDVAVRALSEMEHDDALLVVVGGTSGPAGEQHLADVLETARHLGVSDRIVRLPAQPHHLLSSFYRAADVVHVPSRSESFGLVALEAAACGTPVIASAVGGLATLVDHGTSGFLVPDRDPGAFAAHSDAVLASPQLAGALGAGATAIAGGYTWSSTAGRLRRIYADVVQKSLLVCADAA